MSATWPEMSREAFCYQLRTNPPNLKFVVSHFTWLTITTLRLIQSHHIEKQAQSLPKSKIAPE